MIYTEEMHNFIVEVAPGRWNQEIADLFNERFGTSVTRNMIKCYKSNHKIVSGRSNVDYSKREYYNKLLTDEQLDYLKSIYEGIGNAECAQMINEKFGTSFTRAQIKAQKHRLKLDSALTGHFQKGYVGSKIFEKGNHYSPATEFKKGHTPKNWVPVGTEVFKDGHVHIKVSDVRGVKAAHLINWRLKRNVVWEQHYGPIPKGHVIGFLDNDPKNCSIENLVCLSRSEFNYMKQHHLFSDNPEITVTAINIAKMMSVAIKKKNESANKY